MLKNETWFSRAKAEADTGIPPSERISSTAIAIFSMLMVLFFLSHQTQATGFFTTDFGTLAQVLFYGVVPKKYEDNPEMPKRRHDGSH